MNEVLSLKMKNYEILNINIIHVQATDIELGFPADNIIGYWKMKEDKKFTKRMSANSQPPPEYPPVSQPKS